MLKFYGIHYKTYHNGTYIDTHYGETLAEEGTVKDETIQVNWDNLAEIYRKYSLSLPFNIWNFKKGRLVSFFVGNPFKKDFRDIKEWKSDLNITVEIEYIDISDSKSLEEVLRWRNVAKAIQFLNERNLKIK